MESELNPAVLEAKPVIKWLRRLLLGLFVLVATGYGVAIPPGEGVDEIPHFDYVRFVKTYARLPIQPMTLDEGVEVWMGHHPPLYYVLAAMTIFWSDTSDFSSAFRPSPHFVWAENNGENGWNVYLHFGQDAFPWRGSVLALQAVRFLTIVLGLIAIYAILRSADLMFPHDPWFPIGIAALVAFNPSFLFMSSTVHHDTLQSAVFAVAFWWMISLLKSQEFPVRFYATGGLLVGLAMLTKLSGLSLALIVALALLLKAIRDNHSWRWLWRHALITFSVTLLVAGWWYARNLILYGDPLGWQMFLNIHAHMVRTSAYSWWLFVNEFLGQIGRTLWGGFGYMHITFPQISRYFWLGSALALGGFLLTLVRYRLRFRRQWAEWTVMFSLFILLFISFLRFSIATEGAGHGRYLFPAAFVYASVIMTGLNGLLFKRFQRLISVALFVGLLTYAIWLPLRHVLPRYAPPPSIAATALPEDAVVVHLPLAQGLQLAAYQVESDRVKPDATFPVTLYWQGIGVPALREDTKVNLVLVDAEGNVLAADTNWPVPSSTPAVWSSSELYVQKSNLYVSAQAMPEKLSLVVAPLLTDGAPSDSVEAAGRIVIRELITTGAAVRVTEADITNPRGELFDSQILLRGYAISPETAAAGSILTIDLFWQAVETPGQNATVFVHLLDEQGQLRAQYDRQAGGETLPTSTWQAGEIIRDSYPLFIPDSTEPGTYSVQVGMYVWPSLDRLPITIDGEKKGDSAELLRIRVEPRPQ